MDPLSSARSDPRLAGVEGEVVRAAYDAESGARDRRGASAYALLAVVLLLITIPLDHVRFPDRAGTLMPIRTGGVAALVAILAVLRSAFGERHARTIGVLAPVAVGVVQQALASVTGGPASPINVSTNFVILGISILIPWPATWCALACGLVIGGYVVGTLAVPGAVASAAFVDNLIAFLASSAITIVTAVFRERRRWLVFAQGWSLEQAGREARASAEALRDSEARLRAVIANAPVVLFTLDRAGTVTFSEGKGLDRLGLTPGDLVGQTLSERYPHTADHVARAFAGQAVTWLGSIEDAAFECRLTPVHGRDGRVARVIGVASDVTDRQRAEETRLALERKLLEAQKLESLGALAAGIAHDFNNLLVSVLGNASLALSELPRGSSRTREQLRQIEVAAQRGSDLTRQMLAYAGRGTIALERVDVNALIDETRGLLRVSIPRRVTDRYELAADLPAIDADPTQIRQVLMNLLMNASESIGAGSGAITVRTGTLTLDDAALRETRHATGAAPGPHVFIEVVDTGSGMDTATVEKIFDPFFSTKFAGRGLGLATVLGTVRGHRGALEVRSRPGEGTTFRVFLPCREGRPAEDPPLETAPAPDTDPARTVLLVDDEEDVRMVTQHMLERLGCSVLVAGDGREGVEVFRTHVQMIDAVIVDLTLPGLGGEQAFREIRRIRPDAPVIVISGYDDEGTTRRLAEAGLAGFLRKPFSVAELRSTIDRALAPGRPAGAPG